MYQINPALVGATAATPGIMLTCVKLLEFNRPPYHPWLTVALAEEEIAIQAASEDEIFRMEEAA